MLFPEEGKPARRGADLARCVYVLCTLLMGFLRVPGSRRCDCRSSCGAACVRRPARRWLARRRCELRAYGGLSYLPGTMGGCASVAVLWSGTRCCDEACVVGVVLCAIGTKSSTGDAAGSGRRGPAQGKRRDGCELQDGPAVFRHAHEGRPCADSLVVARVEHEVGGR